MSTNKTIPAHLGHHAAAQDAGQFSPWYRKPGGNPPAPAAADTVAFIVTMPRAAAENLFAKLRRAS